MPRNPPKKFVEAGKDPAIDTPPTIKTPRGKARTMELRASDIAFMRKNEREFRKNPKKALARAKLYSKKKFPNNRKWFGELQSYVGSTANALMEMDMRGELASYPKGSKTKGVIRIQNKWGTPPRKRRKVN